MRHTRFLQTAGALAILLTGSVYAQTILTNSGSWTNPDVWSAGVPVTGVRADIRYDNTATIHNGDAAEAGEVRIGVAEAGTLTLEVGGSLSASSHIRVGHNTEGSMTVQGGTMDNAGNQLSVAYLGGSGIIYMQAGTLDVGLVQLGREGPGTLNLSGGALTATAAFQLGVNAAGSGTIHQTGGQIVMDGTAIFDVGVAGQGFYHISGGSFESTRGLRVGNGAGAGTLRVSDTNATITIRDFTLGSNATYIADIGDSGNGVMPIITTDWNMNLAGSLQLHALGPDVPANVLLFKAEGTDRLNGVFGHVEWHGLSGDLVYDFVEGEVRLENLVPEDPNGRPVIADLELQADGSIEASLETEDGVEYILEFTTDLTGNPTTWSEADRINGTGETEQLIDDQPDDPMRLYRIRRE